MNHSDFLRCVVTFPCLLLLAFQSRPVCGQLALGDKYQGADTLQILPDTTPDANTCLPGLAWEPSSFPVTAIVDADNRKYRIQFPSPRPTGIAATDQVTCEWYPALKDDEKSLKRAPAMIVVHESGSKMVVGRLLATEIGRRGIHAFLVQLPGYGERKSPEFQKDDLVEVFKQGVADSRRARDAVACLPQVDTRHIGIQGTSLGGFVATLAASLDGKLDSQFLLLCGGDIHGVLTSGEKDAKKSLDRLLATGAKREELKQLLAPIEPLRIAQRLEPDKTWLYSASFDKVVPPAHAQLLADKIGLPKEQHVKMLANHYSGIAYLPGIVTRIVETAEGKPSSAE